MTTLDGTDRIAEMPEAPARLVDRARTDRQESGRRLKDRGRVLDLATLSTPGVCACAALGVGRGPSIHRDARGWLQRPATVRPTRPRRCPRPAA